MDCSNLGILKRGSPTRLPVNASPGSPEVVVFLPRPIKGIWRLKFSDLFTELPVPPQAVGVVGIFVFVFLFIY